MVINTFSSFYYGQVVDSQAFIIPLNEGFGEIPVEVQIGDYTLSTLANAVASALNEFGENTYTVSVNRLTRRYTISSDAPFDLLFGSSLNSEISIAPLIGFDLVDLTGLNEYEGQSASGSVYIPQFKLQEFVDFNLFRKSNFPTVRNSASGRVEVVKYADNNFMKCDISFVTDIVNQSVIRNNPNGVSDAIDFMNFATNKKPLEFNYDFEDPSKFERCLLESTQQSREGTDFELSPLYSRGLTGYYELRNLVWRRL